MDFAPTSTLPQSLHEFENLTGRTVYLYDETTGVLHKLEPSHRTCKLHSKIIPLGFVEGVGVIRRTPAGISGLPSAWDEPDAAFLVDPVVVASNPSDPRLFACNVLRKRKLECGTIAFTQLVTTDLSR